MKTRTRDEAAVVFEMHFKVLGLEVYKILPTKKNGHVEVGVGVEMDPPSAKTFQTPPPKGSVIVFDYFQWQLAPSQPGIDKKGVRAFFMPGGRVRIFPSPRAKGPGNGHMSLPAAIAAAEEKLRKDGLLE